MARRAPFVLALLFLLSGAWGAVTSEVSRNDYVGTGSLATYAWTFPVKAATELRVITQDADGQDVELSAGADYSTSALSATGTGSITLTAGNLTNGYKLSIQRGIPYTQTVTPGAAYNAATIANALDRLEHQIVRLKGDVDRAIKIPYLEAGGDSVVKLDDNATNRANQTLVFDSSGNASVGAVTSATASVFGQSLIDDTTASDARTTLGIANIGALDSIATRTVIGRTAGGAGAPSAISPDDVSVIGDSTTTARDLSARFAEVFNVKDFGAVGDNSADDTTAVQAAITAATNAGGGVVWLPIGVYKITSTLQIAGNGVIIRGTGANTSVIQCSGATTGGIKNSNTGSTRSYVTLESFQILAAGSSTAVGVDLWNFQFVTVRDVVAKNFNINLRVVSSYYWNILGHCNFSGAQGGGSINADIELSNAGTITGGTYNQGAAIGIKLVQCNGLVLTGIDAESNTTIALNIDSCVDVVAVTPRLEGNGTGISITGASSSNIRIISPHLSGNSTNYNNTAPSGTFALDDMIVTSYTPTWTGSGSNPAIGNGTLNARYTRTGRTITVTVELTFGTTTTAGTGDWTITLPVACNTNVGATGAAYIKDNGTTFYVGTALVTAGSANVQVYNNNVGNILGATSPMTWANGDQLRFSITYIL